MLARRGHRRTAGRLPTKLCTLHGHWCWQQFCKPLPRFGAIWPAESDSVSIFATPMATQRTSCLTRSKTRGVLMRSAAYQCLGTILLFGALWLQPASCQEIRRDGNWWRTTNLDMKKSYMVGFFDGLVLGRNFSYWNLNGKDGKLDNLETSRVMHSFDESYKLIRGSNQWTVRRRASSLW